MKKRIAALSLVLTIVLSLVPASAGAEESFPAANTYPGFSDVPENHWAADAIRICYDVGLMNGKGEGFDPNGTVTVAEAATVAARLGSALTGTPIPAPEGSAWFVGYCQYVHALATENGWKSTQDTLSEPMTEATRASFFNFLYLTIPEDVLTPINDVTTLPDMVAPADAALRFYNAGVLTGGNEYGSFYPLLSLTRAEMAAIIARVVRPELRQVYAPKVVDPKDLTHCLTGFRDEDVYFTVEGYTVTLGMYLEHFRSAVQLLEELCAEQGVDFNWDHKIDNLSLDAYARRKANTTAICALWEADHPDASLEEENDWLGLISLTLNPELKGKISFDRYYDCYQVLTGGID